MNQKSVVELNSFQKKRHWRKRDFVTEVLIPSIFAKRVGSPQKIFLPPLKQNQVCLTWIGHASFLLQTSELNILIDPNWANWILAFRRLRHAGMEIQQLPHIHVVLITHAHFDHLHKPSLKKIASKQLAIVPKGVASLIKNLGFQNIIEMDWWDTYQIGENRITFIPVRHWGARLLFDKNKLYGGFHVSTPNHSILHLGDTTYFPGFEEIGRRLKPHIVLMPIGSYDTPSRRDNHIDPERAVQAFIELQARWLIPMHFGTYRLSYEPLYEPLNWLVYAASQAGILDQLRILFEGIPEVFTS